MNTTCERWFQERVERRAPGLAVDPAVATRLGEEPARDLLVFLVETACTTRNAHWMQLARSAYASLPREWAEPRILGVIEGSLDLDHEWELRRALELLGPAASPALAELVACGRESPNPDVREAADELSRRWTVPTAPRVPS